MGGTDVTTLIYAAGSLITAMGGATAAIISALRSGNKERKALARGEAPSSEIADALALYREFMKENHLPEGPDAPD